MTALSEVQAAFARYLVDGAGEEALAAQVAGSRELPAAARLDVYRNAFYIRLQDALAHDFPALLAAAGDARFGRLSADYLRERPSTRPSLRWLGGALGDWLRARGEAVFAELVDLEWAVLHAADAVALDEAPPLTASALAQLRPERWPELQLAPHPSVTLLAPRANVRAVWLAVRAGEPRAALEPAEERLVVWRASGGPQVEAVGADCYRLLSALRRDPGVAAACETLAGSIVASEVPRVVAEGLHRALARGWLAARDPRSGFH